ncbi:MAG: hypothetical protein IJ897_02300 [Prevotella sp.]|nr:hypothetical protein [Prevotella sp.]
MTLFCSAKLINWSIKRQKNEGKHILFCTKKNFL